LCSLKAITDTLFNYIRVVLRDTEAFHHNFFEKNCGIKAILPHGRERGLLRAKEAVREPASTAVEVLDVLPD
jgi:hypothetical protein